MDTNSTPAATIRDLFELRLIDGLPVEVDGKTIRYHVVRLRETGVAHERIAEQQAERVVMLNGAPRLLVSDAEFAFAMTVQHVEAFQCDSVTIPAAAIDRTLVGKLSTHDLGLIEKRIFLITLAAEVRYGNMTQQEFDSYVNGNAPAAVASPQPEGQTPDVGADSHAAESGPALLADFSGVDASRKASRDRG
ncbi:phage FluMu protein gp41 [Variovorax boronicumulans]|uniref:hypothetical protein n=1 Tax=Variovorax boronicumulans TaxID=436515 RepID=UPI0027803BDD|nr:hypothetical protein [Variovorax boronicumulans]MDP9990880.1 phage FluMu protein gp41 [Variovorax boronicumulans]MDQ0002908.1 phage FluMu protein gp41 [Variovorax boronicumulans]